MAHIATGDQAAQRRGGPAAHAQAGGKQTPFFIRIPLLCPDRFLSSALPWCRWLISRRFLAVWLVIVIWGTYAVGTQWQRFTETAQVYLAPHTWVYLWLVWCFLKLVHELFHGLFCKKYGGHVGSAGVALILFSPVAFLDVSSSWRFRSRWQRICTSAGGIYIELLVAGVAAIVWSQLQSGTLSHVCHSVVLMASLTTLLFNANPLMRFDGYYVLADLLEIHNLYGGGQQYVRGLLRRIFLGLSTNSTSQHDAPRRWIIKTYGVATAVWRIVVCLSMVLLASTLFHGAGLVIALSGVVSWFALPCYRFVKRLIVGHPNPNEKPDRLRFAIASGATWLLVAAALSLPWPGGVSAHATVTYAGEEIVRASAAGFVEQVHVTLGQPVNEHQLLVTLRNDELQAELAEAKLAVQRANVRARILLHRKLQAAYQAEQAELRALQQRQSQLQAQVDCLQVRAPRGGTVLGGRPAELLGQFIDLGAPLLTIADRKRKEIQLAIAETHIDVFLQNVGNVPAVRVVGGPARVNAGQLVKVEPRASVVLRQPALAGIHGGPLAVRDVRAEGSEAPAQRPRFELETPRFHGVVELPANEALRLRAGQLAKVRIHDWSETVGRRAYRTVKSWVERKLHQRGTSTT